MFDANKISRFYDANGELVEVRIPAGEWRKIEPLIAKFQTASPAPATLDSDSAMDEFKRFMAAWDYRYDYDPAVKCPVCSTETLDWRADAARPFALKTASLGGTLIFVCAGCGSIIRHKYFRYNFETEVDSAVS
ncbi:MAG: hypothetical protein HDQ93_03470 [Desulfovibrio sp.]|nr:hypothetical protein [Desulfovibrio sp.]